VEIPNYHPSDFVYVEGIKIDDDEDEDIEKILEKCW
jgi:hypothetical protein